MRLRGQEAPPDTSERPWVLVVDDGELEEVKRAAEELGATTRRLSLASRGRPWRQPQRLLAVCDRRALTLGRPTAQEEDRFTTLVVMEEGSKRLRREIARMGFDYVLEPPLDPDALRSLVREALYRGQEQRASRRVPVSRPVILRVGWRSYDARLAELTPHTCSLRLSHTMRMPREVELTMPGSWVGGKGLSVRGEVTRQRMVGNGEVELTVRFRHTSLSLARLSQVVESAAPPPPQPSA